MGAAGQLTIQLKAWSQLLILDLSRELNRAGGVCSAADSQATIASFQLPIGDHGRPTSQAGVGDERPHWGKTPILVAPAMAR